MFLRLCPDLQEAVLQWGTLAELLAVRGCSLSLCARFAPEARPRSWRTSRPSQRAIQRWLVNTGATVASLQLLQRAYDYTRHDVLVALDNRQNNPIMVACLACDLARARWLAERFVIAKDDMHGIERVFTITCERGRLDVARWLEARFVIYAAVPPSHAQINDRHFTLLRVCDAGHLDVFQWLVGLAPSREPRRTWAPAQSQLFETACNRGHLDIVQWLAAQYEPTASDVLLSSALVECCVHGHLGVAKWLMAHFRLRPNNVRKRLAGDGVRSRAELHGHAAMAAWLTQNNYGA
jgi:hypothetical protein